MKKVELTYEQQINALIPEASKLADVRTKALPYKTEWRTGLGSILYNWDYWTQFFHEEMNKLAREAGLRR